MGSQTHGGKVWLVGAGPGDPDLITVKGLRVLENADVVVYDEEITPDLIERAGESAEVVYAGAQPGMPAMSREEIGRLLVTKAREGGRVVRLKGGDPFVFGAVVEEAEALVAGGIPFEVINGPTATVSAPARAGIPILSDGVASSYAVVLGNRPPGDPDDRVDWRGLATAADTLVLVAATPHLDRIARELIGHGRDAATPVAVVSWGSHARHAPVVGTLGDIAERIAEAGVQPPALTVIGEVVALRERLRWYDDRPLFGKRVLVTRLRQQAGALRRMFEDEGAEVVELPTVEIVEGADQGTIRRVIEGMSDGQYGWVVFTTPHAVDLFFRHLYDLGRDARAFGSARICAVGDSTVEALGRRGIRPDASPSGTEEATMIEALASRSVGRRRILVPRADNLRPGLLASLRRVGAEVEEVPLYVSSMPRNPNRESLARLRRGEIDVVTFASAASVTNLLALLGDDVQVLRHTTVACMGTNTAQVAREHGLRVQVTSAEADIKGLLAGVREACSPAAVGVR